MPPSGIATIYTPRRFIIFLRRTTIPNSSFLISHSRKAFIHNQWTEPPKELTLNPLSFVKISSQILLTSPLLLDIIILLWCTINGTTRCKEVFIHGKDDIPAEQPLEKTDPRFPRSYENKSRPYCSEEKKSKGQKGIKCLIKKSARRGWGIHCPALLVSDRTGITVGFTDPANVSAIGPGSAMW